MKETIPSYSLYTEYTFILQTLLFEIRALIFGHMGDWYSALKEVRQVRISSFEQSNLDCTS